MEGGITCGKTQSGKEPGVRGGGRRVRNSARGDEAENKAITECFSGKASKSQVMPDWGSLITLDAVR